MTRFVTNDLMGQEHPSKFVFSTNMGLAGSYTDRAYLLSTQAGFGITYLLNENYGIQFSPKYNWLIKWNEHYLCLPIHLTRNFGQRITLYAGPALTFDVGYFKDVGFSGGVSYKIKVHSSLALSAFTITLYDYHIDYLYVPVSISYKYSF